MFNSINRKIESTSGLLMKLNNGFVLIAFEKNGKIQSNAYAPFLNYTLIYQSKQ